MPHPDSAWTGQSNPTSMKARSQICVTARARRDMAAGYQQSAPRQSGTGRSGTLGILMTRRAFGLLCSAFCRFAACLWRPLSAPRPPDANHKEAVDIFRQLIEINTTDSVGSVTAAAKPRSSDSWTRASRPRTCNCSAPTTANRTWWCAITAQAAKSPSCSSAT